MISSNQRGAELSGYPCELSALTVLTYTCENEFQRRRRPGLEVAWRGRP